MTKRQLDQLLRAPQAILIASALAGFLAAWNPIAPHGACAEGIPDLASEIPLPQTLGNEARPLGMGGAGLAISDDGSAVMWNPAGLAQMRRIEVSSTLSHDRNEFSSDLGRGGENVASTSTNLGSARLVYPVPTYRGALVFAIGNDQFRNYDQELELHTIDGLQGQRLDLRDTVTESGKLHAWNIAAAFEASPRLFIGGALYLFDGEDRLAVRQITEDLDDANPDTLLLDDVIETESDISGYSGKLGVLYRASPNLSFGATVHSAMPLTFEGAQTFDELTVYDDGDEDFAPLETIYFTDELTFPPSFGAGVAGSVSGLIVALDLHYTDWSQIEFENPGTAIRNRRLQEQYEDKVTVNLGAEYLVGSTPLRVRAGYLYDPVPFRLFFPEGARPTEVGVENDRQFFTLGAGILIDTVLTLDVAFQTGSFTRESRDYSEERELQRLVVSSAFRF